MTDPKIGPSGCAHCSRATILLVAIAGLSLHMSVQGDSCFPGMETIAAETGLSVRQVRRALRALERGGWLHTKVGGGRNRSSRYFIRMPSRARHAMSSPEGGVDFENLTCKKPGPGGPGFSVNPDQSDRKPGPERPETRTTWSGEDVIRSSGGRHDELPSNVVSLSAFAERRASGSPPSPPSVETSTEPPAWTFVWAWSRARGEQRVFPQAGLPEYPGDTVLSLQEYGQLEAQWRADGSPRSFDPRLLLLNGKIPAGREVVPT